jgi:DNA-binding transcriptional ArsR family regulator
MNQVIRSKAVEQADTLAAIVSHPLRRRLWAAIAERPISPRELADRLLEPINDVAYHVRKLRDLGVIEPAGTRPVRGATQHFYRASRRPDFSNEEVEALSPEQSAENAAHVLQLEFADCAAALETGVLTARPEHYVYRLPVTLDEQGWQDFHTVIAEAAERLVGAETRCVDRRRSGEEGDDSVSIVVHLNLFERG